MREKLISACIASGGLVGKCKNEEIETLSSVTARADVLVHPRLDTLLTPIIEN